MMIIEESKDQTILIPKVDVLHRTVYDFLGTKDLQTFLDGNLQTEFRPSLSLCKAFHARI